MCYIIGWKKTAVSPNLNVASRTMPARRGLRLHFYCMGR
jgi:hypothetical protein